MTSIENSTINMVTCDEYDYVEVACLFRYPLRLTLKNDEIVEGKALDTKRNVANQECIELTSNGIGTLVVLDSIIEMTVLMDNPHFTTVRFNDGD